jgi:NADPH2:quinone reductase
MRAVVAAPGSDAGLEIREVAEPEPGADEALVEVRACSVNRGEVRALRNADDGWRPGWDVAGVVLQRAANGHGPAAGERVVGLARGAGWAERAAVPIGTLSVIPTNLGFAEAATLPMAGLTALRTLGIADQGPDDSVMITGAAGGVGRFAVQLAAQMGATVTAVVGRPERMAAVEGLGARDVIVGLPDSGSFDVILESVGGDSLATALTMVAPGGAVVSYGNSSGEPASFDPSAFYPHHGARLIGFQIFAELDHLGSGCIDLGPLAREAAAGRLDVGLSRAVPWTEARGLVHALMDRQIDGKGVMLIGE